MKEAATAKYIISYLAYGVEASKYQAILSIYTLCHQLGEALQDYQVVIYTDTNRSVLDKYLAGLPVKLEVISKEQATIYKGADNYVFRLKPCVMKDYFATYKQDLFFIDTDTFFLCDPTPLLQSIAPGHSLMNAQEYDFVDGGRVEPMHWFTLRQGLKKTTYTVFGDTVAIPLSTMMWNSGVIGMSPADAGLIEEMISLNDQLYRECRTFNVEQFAVTYILQTATQLRSSGDYIDHYWSKYNKNTYNQRIPGFLKKHAGRPGPALYAQAFAFAQEIRHVLTPHPPLADRISTRLKMIVKVARQGHL
ncbi:MAG: hypothetical protein EOO63_05880 [Hymenobacter sp.]|nr:MAG: hypothetical protein EOO63_05880 [Hymenobacter sp.]